MATDLLARGIDIDEVALVVNFDVPREPESYVHRIGRTGRAGDSGEALTLVSPRDRRAFSAIESVLKIKIPVDGRGIPARPARDARQKGHPRKSAKAKSPKKSGNHTAPEQSTDATAGTAEAPQQQKPRPKRHFHRRHKGKNPKGGATATPEA